MKTINAYVSLMRSVHFGTAFKGISVLAIAFFLNSCSGMLDVPTGGGLAINGPVAGTVITFTGTDDSSTIISKRRDRWSSFDKINFALR